jgi:glucose-6-phosphate 1-dehydrogenase
MKDVTFVIFGATGDLTEKKLIPAIYNMFNRGKIDKFLIIGAARREINKDEILDQSRKNISNINQEKWAKIVENFEYFKINFDSSEDYDKMRLFIIDNEEKRKIKGDRIFYLATLPEHFHPITKNIALNNIDKCYGESKVLYEKPFGSDFKSAKMMNRCINKVFDEKHIYRVDHYLGKELIGNIVLLRFTNRILEPLWNNKNIESVQIIFDEDVDVNGRGSYYDKYGAIKDVLQNHGLQVLSLIGMESPKMLTGDYIRDKKAEVLKKTEIKDVFLAQFEGYLNEEGVKKDSKTETFVSARFEINNKRWRGVPFFVRAGKALAKKESVIHIKFKKVDCLLAENCPSDSNYLSIRIQPNEGFSFEINSKKIGETFNIEKSIVDYCHTCIHQGNTPEAYEIIFEEAIKGEKSIFVRNDEIELSWKIIDSIDKENCKINLYKKGSFPSELENWSKKNKIRWKS